MTNSDGELYERVRVIIARRLDDHDLSVEELAAAVARRFSRLFVGSPPLGAIAAYDSVGLCEVFSPDARAPYRRTARSAAGH